MKLIGDRAKRFWQRATSEPSRGRIAFDIVVGIVAPILCFVFDPFVFRCPSYFLCLFPNLRPFAYVGSGVAMITLALWLILGRRTRLYSGIVAGVLLTAALFALAIGIVLFPFSLLGLLYVIGVFGLAPLVVAFVFLRNGVIALRCARERISTAAIVASALAGLIIVAGFPAALNYGTYRIVYKSVQTIIHGDDGAAAQATQQLKSAFWCSAMCYDDIAWAYHQEQDEARRSRLERAYEAITGKDVQSRLWMLLD